MSDSPRLSLPTSSKPAARAPFKSKTRAALLAFLFGSVGTHRFYLHGRRDVFAYLHIAGLALGVAGTLLLVATHRTSITGWLLAIPGAVSILAALLAAIVYGLKPDDKWDAHFNPGCARVNRSGWGVVFVVILSLFIGAMLLMGGLAVGFQTYFEATTQPIDQRL
jgi:TM2 domain-containing membrane protein YozV